MRKNWIYEAIATTFNKNKKPNSAAVGFYTKDFRTVVIELYKTSKTCDNVLREKEFAINFTGNISLFYKSSISKKGLKYAKAKKINAPILKDADGYLELKSIGIEDLNDKVRIESEVIDSKINKNIILINRAKSLALESIINATKIPYIPDSDKNFLKKEIQKYKRVIKKTAPNSEYERITKYLNNKTK